MAHHTRVIHQRPHPETGRGGQREENPDLQRSGFNVKLIVGGSAPIHSFESFCPLYVTMLPRVHFKLVSFAQVAETQVFKIKLNALAKIEEL